MMFSLLVRAVLHKQFFFVSANIYLFALKKSF